MKFSKAEVEAIIEAAPRTFIPFNKLVRSEDLQARSGDVTPKLSLPELAASIRECGVLQNLVVVQGARGRYEVCAGGRRLAALGLLVGQRDIADNYPVPVLIVPADKALIASLSENCFHVPMHPADEFAAFAKLIAQGKSVEDVAATFGVAPLVVKRRMKLASVSPKLMALYRQGDIGLDCLMVLASVDDHDRQEQAWAGLPTWNQRPDHLRQLLTRGEVESDSDPVAKFVTLKAYEKAGGGLRRDLFSDDDKKAYLLDTPLLERLATDKLHKRAKQVLAQGWKWVDLRVRYVYDEYVKHGELRKARREPTPDEAAAVQALDTRISALHGQMEALADQDADDEGSDRDYLALEAEADTLQEQRKDLESALSVWPAEWMAQAGCVVHVGSNGSAAVKFGLIRPEDRTEVAQASRQATESGEHDPLVSLPSPSTRPVHSEKLLRRLTAHRVAAVQAELLTRPDVAEAALAAHLSHKLLRDGLQGTNRCANVLAVSATDNRHELHSAAEDIETSSAGQRMQVERSVWIDRLPKDPEVVFPWLLKQEPATVQQLLTFLVAATVNGIYGTEPERHSNEPLAQALGLDMTRWWTATADSYFNHVSKARVLEVVTEAIDANAASPLAALKKDAVVAGAEQTLAGRAWLPKCLRIEVVDIAGRSASGHTPGMAEDQTAPVVTA